ncbi:unnamed protein product [Moneuplotes crassus]|uniref:Uncharacterized protein n=1 Tax=Euplotes crassus TaxID=5936 RepID=A0AAD2CX34_EUPCR|nr:unnamed protein product [Moneuplotes crassus]
MFGPNSVRTLLKLKTLVKQSVDDLNLEEEKRPTLEQEFSSKIPSKTMTNFRKSTLKPLSSSQNEEKYDYAGSSDDQEVSEKEFYLKFYNLLYEDDNFREFKEVLQEETEQINKIQSEQRDLSRQITQALADIQDWRESRKKAQKDAEENQKSPATVLPQNTTSLDTLLAKLDQKSDKFHTKIENLITSLQKSMSKSSTKMNVPSVNPQSCSSSPKVPELNHDSLQKEIEQLKNKEENYEDITDKSCKIREEYTEMLDELAQIESQFKLEPHQKESQPKPDTDDQGDLDVLNNIQSEFDEMDQIFKDLGVD